MDAFYEFIKQREMMALPGPGSKSEAQNEVSQAVSRSLQGSLITDSEVAKFSGQVGAFVTSDDFLQELSDSIGKPEANESREAFVNRCKETMFGILSKRLG